CWRPGMATRLKEPAIRRFRSAGNASSPIPGTRSVCPAQQRRPYRESRPHRSQQHQIAFFQLTLLAGGVHGQRDSPRGGIAVAIDVDDHAFGAKAEAIGGGGDNALVGLMRNKSSDVTSLQPIALQKFLAEFRLLTNGKLENRLAILMDVMHFLLDRLVRGRVQASSPRHVEETAAGTVNFMQEIDQTDRVVVSRFEEYAAAAISENDAGSSIGVVNDRRHPIGPNDQHFPMCPGSDELRAGLESVKKCRTGRR